MKKIFLALSLGVMSASTMADKPLLTQYGEPAKMGVEPVKQKSSSSSLSNLSVNAGYSGSMINKEGLKFRSKGWELGATYQVVEEAGVYARYKQEKDELKLKEFSVGGVYDFYNQNNVYINGSLGLGYATAKASYEGDSVKLKYITIPVGLEAGYKFTPHVAVYGGVGYEWMFNNKAKACLDNECYSADGVSDLDVNGTTYRAGLKYIF